MTYRNQRIDIDIDIDMLCGVTTRLLDLLVSLGIKTADARHMEDNDVKLGGNGWGGYVNPFVKRMYEGDSR